MTALTRLTAAARAVVASDGGAIAPDGIYTEDLFSTYVMTGKNTQTDIRNGLVYGGTAAWSAIKIYSTYQLVPTKHFVTATHVYIIGYAYDSATTLAGYVLKMTLAGTIVWQKTMSASTTGGGADFIVVRDVIVDASGNVYVSGHIATGGYSTLCKFASDGTPVWQRRWANYASGYSSGSTYGYGIAFTTTGDIIQVGYGVVDGATTATFVLRWTPAGVLSNKIFDRNGVYGGASVSCYIDAANKLYVGGYLQIDGSTFAGSITIYDVSSGIVASGVTPTSFYNVAQSNAGTFQQGLFYDIYSDVNSVWVTGQMYSSAGIPTAYVTRFTNSLSQTWARELSVPEGGSATSLAVDSTGASYVLGNVSNTTNDAILCKYDGSGNLVWQNYFSGCQPRSVRLSADGTKLIVLLYDGTNANAVLATVPIDGTAKGGTAYVSMSAGVANSIASAATNYTSVFATEAAGQPSVVGTPVHNTTTFSASAATQSAFTGQGGMIMFKDRTNGTAMVMIDSVRGPSKYLTASEPNSGDANSFSDTVKEFTTDGVTIGTNALVNNFTAKMVSWGFKRQAKFFDILTWTGDGTTGRKLNHILGNTPGMIMARRLDVDDYWKVWVLQGGITPTGVIGDGSALGNDGTTWATTDPTTFTLGDPTIQNELGGKYLAYLFANDSSANGVIRCGSFTTIGGNQTIDLGWEAQFLLYRQQDGGNGWNILDTQRGFVMDMDIRDMVLRMNTSAAEVASGQAGPAPEGFRYFDGTTGKNVVYMAIRIPNKPPTLGRKVFVPLANYTSSTTAIKPGFDPDLVISKQDINTATGSWYWIDKVRGAGSTSWKGVTSRQFTMASNTTSADIASGTRTAVDNQTRQFIYERVSSGLLLTYSFKRAPGFFDIVNWLGNALTNRSLRHNLQAVPEMIITHCRTTAVNWAVWIQGYFLPLNLTTPGVTTAPTGGGIIPNTNKLMTVTAPTSDVSLVNGASNSYISYLFATLPGISKVGTYVGNGGTTGTNGASQNINCGFTTGARFILARRVDTAGDWVVFDTARGMNTTNDPYLFLNAVQMNSSPGGETIIALLSGFTVVQQAATNLNITGATYVYLAIA